MVGGITKRKRKFLSFLKSTRAIVKFKGIDGTEPQVLEYTV